MASQNASLLSDVGQTRYAYPKKPFESLNDWATHAVQLVESPAPNQGFYSGVLDDRWTEWAVFPTATQPSSFAEAIATITITPERGFLLATTASGTPGAATDWPISNGPASGTHLVGKRALIGSGTDARVATVSGYTPPDGDGGRLVLSDDPGITFAEGLPVLVLPGDLKAEEAQASAVSVDGKLTAERAAKLDGVAQASDLAGISGGGPLLQEDPTWTVTLHRRSDGVMVADRTVRLYVGEDPLVAIECKRITRRNGIESMAAPTSTSPAVATASTAEGEYGVMGTLAKVRVTAVSEGTSQVRASLEYSGGQTLLVVFGVEVSAAP